MDYMYNVFQPQVPLDEIRILLYAQMYKIHTCNILEGKCCCTNCYKALNRATISMIYKGYMMSSDTTRKGYLHSSMFEDIGGGNYQLQSHGPIDELKDVPAGGTTLNSMHAGLMDKKQLAKAKRDYDKMNRSPPVPKQKEPSPKHKPELNVKVHGIPVMRPRKRDLKCSVCRKIYHLVKELNVHIKQSSKI